MKTYQILETVKNVANATQGVNSFSNRDIYNAINTNEVKYPIICMALESVTVRENYKTCTFQFYAAERLQNGEENRQYAMAELIDIAELYMHNLSITEGIVDVEFDRQYNIATYTTMDECVCIYSSVNIDIQNDYSVC